MFNYPPHHFIIVALDPGTDTLGVSVMGLDLYDFNVTIYEAWTFHASHSINPLGVTMQTHGSRRARLEALGKGLDALLRRVRPHAIISESPFLGRFAQSFEALTQCVDMIREVVMNYNIAMVLEMVDPPSAKKAIGAAIQGPDKKEAVRLAVLKYPFIRAPGVYLESLEEHATDAIAVGMFKVNQIKEYYRARTC